MWQCSCSRLDGPVCGAPPARLRRACARLEGTASLVSQRSAWCSSSRSLSQGVGGPALSPHRRQHSRRWVEEPAVPGQRPRRASRVLRRGGTHTRVHGRPAAGSSSPGWSRLWRRRGALCPAEERLDGSHLRRCLFCRDRGVPSLPAGLDRSNPWTVLSTTGVGDRYFFSAEVAWLVCVAWALSRIRPRAVRWAAAGAVTPCSSGASPATRNTRPLVDFHPAVYDAQLRAAPPGAVVRVPLNPNPAGQWR